MKANSSDLDVLAQAAEILSKEMKPSEMARLYSILGLGKGDYIKLKDEMFRGETVDSLLKKINDDRKNRGKSFKSKPATNKSRSIRKAVSGKQG